ncbi:PstS family phosphate ABC transporter substrate-binding protein [Paenibacillus sp. 1P07SE]|uniref:PstS family phosphate ABC transporter substrate-binding protein n=1 Tax=Paenibacillus sp. 1P07SE TaxID=3132209 RepID=UPI0039A48928
MFKKAVGVGLLIAAVSVTAACGSGTSNEGGNTGAAQGPSNVQNETTNQPPVEETPSMSGQIEIDGSSTVFPLMEAVAEEFSKEYKDVRVPVGVSGTGGGFKRFCAGETDISNASRPIKAEEAEACEAAGVEFIELKATYDGISVVLNPANDWVDHFTVEELNAIFKPDSTVVNWSDVRPEWPSERIEMFVPGADSGTFDYFTEVINGKSQESRNDSQISFSEDDNVLVQGVAGSKNGIGYFGLAYYEENQDKLRDVAIVNKEGNAVLPSEETVMDQSYNPLGRPLFIYVKKSAYEERPEVETFAKYFMDNTNELAAEVGYIPLPEDMLAEEKAKLQ